MIRKILESYGASLRPKTEGQRNYIRTIVEHEFTFCSGPAGSSKSFTPTGLACQYLLEGRYFKIVFIRPAIESSKKGIGFLKGLLDQKLAPYIAQAEEHLKYFLGESGYKKELNSGNIEFHPLEFLRGKTFHNSFVILDEAQNADKDQLIMAVTRLGQNSKLVCNGDPRQTDLRVPNSEYSTDFEYVIHKLEQAQLDNFGLCQLGEADIVRNPNIAPFLRLFE
ncbi:MAG: PhoH family protein [Nitrososphaerales archaeon]